YRTERRAAVAAPRKWRRAGTLELDVTAHPVGIDHLAKQNGAAVAELRNERTDLGAGIGHRDRVRAVGNPLSREDFGSLRAVEPVGIEAELGRERPVQLDEPGRGDRRRRDPCEKVRG